MIDPDFDSVNICETCKYNYTSNGTETWCTYRGKRATHDRDFDANGVCIYCQAYTEAYTPDDDDYEESEEDDYDEWN